MYPHIQTLFLKTIDKLHLTKWNKDFPAPDLINSILMGYNKIKKLCTSETLGETHNKLVHRAYSTFFHMHQTDNSNRSVPK